jgi:hypothetical protein
VSRIVSTSGCIIFAILHPCEDENAREVACRLQISHWHDLQMNPDATLHQHAWQT